MASKVLGNTQGLKPSQLKSLQRLFARRYPVKEGYTTDQAHELAALSRIVGRQIALLIDRQGKPQMVLVGDTGAIYIPELPRARSSSDRLRGLRLVHTHLNESLLSQEDLMDMLFLRLDSISVLTVDGMGTPGLFQSAHILPVPSEDGTAYNVHGATSWENVDIDFEAQTDALEEELARTADSARKQGGTEHAVLVSVSTLPKDVQESHLNELAELADTAGVSVAGRLVQRVRQVNHKFIMGRGKLSELEILCLQGNASMIIFDGELSPAQLRNLTEVTERKVIDRTQLILDIFAQHATTRAGKLQVEMAQLQYSLPRLVGKNRAMDRLMGGIGGRGPGETKLETDRRKVRDRISRFKKELDSLRKQRSFARDRRNKARVPVAALVGYTNAGKSTTLNALTNSTVLAENKLFATLDPTTRRLRFPEDRELILTDTVGFIRNLPKELREAFRATLEELEAADLLLHVADAGHPELEKQIAAVDKILEDMDLHEIPTTLILNKWDALDNEQKEALMHLYPHAIHAAAKNRMGLDEISQEIIDRIDWERGMVN